MRALIAVLAALAMSAAAALAEPMRLPAPALRAGGDRLTVYSTLDAPLARPLLAAFQAANPGLAIVYEELLAGEIAARVRAETDAGGRTADVTFSSAIDLQVQLANDGYARPVRVAGAGVWPRWANWRDTVFALTFEPAVVVWHRPSVPDPPLTRLALIDWIAAQGPALRGRIGTYDIERSAVGFLYLARDEEHFPDIWALIGAMAGAGLQTWPTSQDILDRVADGRLALGYNILGSYAAEVARLNPDLGVAALQDYTVAISRAALVPKAAVRPDLGARLVEWLMSPAGQQVLAEALRLPALSLQIGGPPRGQPLARTLGDPYRPVPLGPGLLAYLDRMTRDRLIGRWRQALAQGPSMSGR
ncbi:MAG: ABC transporter substrate-binding protein [Rhodobacterales bacterium]|nr:ABC transporter substrate-binding protein [Rhodobacterales bacterium]